MQDENLQSNGGRDQQFFVRVFGKIFHRLPPRRQSQFWWLVVYMVFFSLVATLAAGAIAVFAAAFSSPEEISTSRYVVMARDFFALEILRSPKGIMVCLSLLMVLLVSLKNMMESLLYYCVARYGAAIEAYFGGVLFRGFLRMPYEWHLNRNSADIILALQWRSYIGHSFFNTALNTMSDCLLVVFLLSAVFLANPLIAIVVFAVAGGIAYAIYCRIHHLQEREAERCREYDQSINRQTTKGIHGIKDVKVSGKTSFLSEFEDSAYAFARIQGMRSFYGRLPIGLLETIGFAVLAGAIIFLLFFTQSSTMEVTAVISLLIVSAWRVLPAISRIMAGFMTMRNILPYIRVELEYLEEIDAPAAASSVPAGPAEQEIRFSEEVCLRDISFSYHGREHAVLTDIDLRIKKGQTIGIIGCSGVGKSTLVDIIIGLLTPRKGTILVDGCELNGQNIPAWLKKLSYVPQTPYIFDGSIAENIAFGEATEAIDREYVLECCRMAFLQDILQSLPQGIDTMIGERGMRLSGGQRQRVAIARALYTRPELMIFDEATSSLDSRSERAIQDTIAALKGQKTMIIVAHRLQTVEKCDFLVWLEAGRIKMADAPKNVLCGYEQSLR